eukprot:759473-Prorocentrum_lima.AAC.1
MTSSLVGSEMCIRDSPNPGKLHPDYMRGSGSPRTRAEWWKIVQETREVMACLLYTSDAADDM